MANLTDFMEPQLMTEAETVVRAKPEFEEWQKLGETCNGLLKQGVFTGGSRLSQPERDIVKREEEIITGFWRDYHFLPAEMANSVLGETRNGKTVPYQRKVASLVKYATLPRTKLSHIRNAAEKLSFAIISYEYINPDGIVAKYAEEGQKQYAKEIKTGFEDVDEFRTKIKTYAKIDLYILCPIGFYDLWQEVKDEQTKQKIFGGELSQTAMTLSMIMPAQKNLYQMSKANEQNIESLRCTMESNFAEMKKNLDHLQNQISWLADVMKIVQTQASQALGTANAALSKAKQVEYRLMCMLDPLIFAVPKGTDLYDDDAVAHLMMCFGADMPVDFFLERGLVRIKDNGYYDPIVKTYN